MGSSASSPAGVIPSQPIISRSTRNTNGSNNGTSNNSRSRNRVQSTSTNQGRNATNSGRSLPNTNQGGSGTRNSHIVLSRPYAIVHRTPTDGTVFAEGGPFPVPSGSQDRLATFEEGMVGMTVGSPTAIVPTRSTVPSSPLVLRRVGSNTDGVQNSSPYQLARRIASQPGSSSGSRPVERKSAPLPLAHQTPVMGLAPVSTPCLNPASEINSRLDTQVEVRVYPCNNNNNGSHGKKKFTQFTVKPEGVIIQGTNRRSDYDLGSEYARHVGRKLQRYELADTRACQLLVTSHHKSFWVVPAPEAFSRHSGTCRLLGDRKHPPTPHTMQVGDFLRVGSVGVVVIETHDGSKHRALSEEKIQRIMKDTASGGFIDFGETDGENSDVSIDTHSKAETVASNDQPVCYMCFDEADEEDNPLITPCKCLGDTRFVHVECLRKWHTAEADNQICFLSSVDATCSVCKSTFKSDFKLRNGKTVKLFKSSLEPPYVSLLVATKHEMAQRLFNTRFQLSFSTLLKPDRKNGTRALLMGRSSGSDMVLDYRTVSARHASIRFKNGEFIFNDAGSSNGSYLYLRRPVELTSSQSVQFRLGRSMISMKVVNKWNRRLLRAVRRTHSSSPNPTQIIDHDEHSIGSDEEVNIIDEETGNMTKPNRRTRESIMLNLPPPGQLSQNSNQHLDLLYALAYPKRMTEAQEKKKLTKKLSSLNADEEGKSEDDAVPQIEHKVPNLQPVPRALSAIPSVGETLPSSTLGPNADVSDIDA
mmetsp:Transcript_9104/g.11214  ORF Transcript_9104/g.11214 Transcript_9104/m.11214 type:complete len:758 (-) Transcript_9104:310-2583(-)|eukprot:CAMPEP_0172506962 /NCGR_PEP_ID=MMETSP1066-20121228/200004_1 /TAXON_ID=671091 /ORGANISM="Coscinodiscus wailesii, Strain CCMP2513" /LENGTH=757 /DNA_ID=CAMNT_0013284279 /DNA_START=107 /DNA_END=2380 /DNA_ORIENTATION=-